MWNRSKAVEDPTILGWLESLGIAYRINGGFHSLSFITNSSLKRSVTTCAIGHRVTHACSRILCILE